MSEESKVGELATRITGSSMNRRLVGTSENRSQKWEDVDLAKGCSRCGASLSPNVIILPTYPFMTGGAFIVQDGKAICERCYSKSGVGDDE